MDLVQQMNSAPRCSATSKRSRLRCRAPAARSWKVCRSHGARGGAPKGKANGAWKHGRFTGETDYRPAPCYGLDAERAQDDCQIIGLSSCDPIGEGQSTPSLVNNVAARHRGRHLQHLGPDGPEWAAEGKARQAEAIRASMLAHWAKKRAGGSAAPDSRRHLHRQVQQAQENN
jgi:hypothetical protein